MTLTKHQRKMQLAAFRDARKNPVTTLRTEREAFAAHAKRRPRITGANVQSNQLMRGACHGASQLDGKDIAANIATGNLRVAQRSTDAAGPLRENVGLTTQRGGDLDYLRTRSSRFERNAHPTSVATRNAAAIARYNSKDES